MQQIPPYYDQNQSPIVSVNGLPAGSLAVRQLKTLNGYESGCSVASRQPIAELLIPNFDESVKMGQRDSKKGSSTGVENCLPWVGEFRESKRLADLPTSKRLSVATDAGFASFEITDLSDSCRQSESAYRSQAESP